MTAVLSALIEPERPSSAAIACPWCGEPAHRRASDRFAVCLRCTVAAGVPVLVDRGEPVARLAIGEGS